MSDKLAERLFSSSFATIEDAQRFTRWYEQAKNVTDWDKTRARQAAELIELADAEKLLVDIDRSLTGFEIEDLCDMDD